MCTAATIHQTQRLGASSLDAMGRTKDQKIEPLETTGNRVVAFQFHQRTLLDPFITIFDIYFITIGNYQLE